MCFLFEIIPSESLPICLFQIPIKHLIKWKKKKSFLGQNFEKLKKNQAKNTPSVKKNRDTKIECKQAPRNSNLYRNDSIIIGKR